MYSCSYFLQLDRVRLRELSVASSKITVLIQLSVAHVKEHGGPQAARVFDLCPVLYWELFGQSEETLLNRHGCCVSSAAITGTGLCTLTLSDS